MSALYERRNQLGHRDQLAFDLRSSGLVVFGTSAAISGRSLWVVGETGSLIPPRPTGATWLASAVDDMLDWLNQGEGWDSYGAERISAEAVSRAANILRDLSCYGVPRPFITGDVDGGIGASWESDRYSVQLSFSAAAVSLFYWDKYRDEQSEGPLELTMDKFGPILWYLSHGRDGT
jgi:hypothetical protein